MIDERDIETVGSSVIFSGCSSDQAADIAEKNGSVESFRRNETFSLCPDQPRFGVILEGEAAIYSEQNEKPALLRVAGRGDPIGIAGLYSDMQIKTCCRAKGEICRICFFTRESFEKILSGPGGVAVRLSTLKFLSNRVAFLNRRISCLTGGSSERKLASFILSHTGEDGSFINDLTMKSLSSAIDVGRASLYRALDRLTCAGAISYENNNITITDRSLLMKICGE